MEYPNLGIIIKLLKKIVSIAQYNLLVKLFKTITFEQICNKDSYDWIIEWYKYIYGCSIFGAGLFQ